MNDISLTSASETDASPMRLNRRQAAKVRTRHKVLEAARNLFAERGYDAATIRDIAKTAGMSTGAVFANFQDKAELFDAVQADEMAAVLDAFQAGAASDGPVAERLTNLLASGYHRAQAHLPLTQAMIARSWFQPAAADRRLRALVQPISDTVVAVLRDGVAGGELRQDLDAPLLGGMIWTLYLANIRRAAYDGWTSEQLVPHTARQMETLLAGHLAR